jgi:hypothetical protein
LLPALEPTENYGEENWRIFATLLQERLKWFKGARRNKWDYGT